MEVNTSSNLRECFMADPGHVFVIADLAQIEPRITAHYAAQLHKGMEAKCPLLQVFTKGIDLYAALANEVLGLNLSDDQLTKSVFKKKYPEYRDVGKTIQLATTYGLGPDKFAWKLQKVTGREYSYREAKSYIDKYWEKYWDVQALRLAIQEEVATKKYIDTLFGRKLYLSQAETRHKGLNYKIQCSASDYCLFSQIWVQQVAQQYKIPYKLLLIVHDEVVYQVPKGAEEEFSSVLKTIMTLGWTKFKPNLKLLVPLELDIGVGNSWAAKS